MRASTLLLAAAAALLAVCSLSNSGAHATPATSRSVKDIEDALKDTNNFLNLFTHDIFAKTTVNAFATFLQKQIGIVLPLMDLIFKPEDSISRLLKSVAELHVKIDNIDLKLRELENLVNWNTIKQPLAAFVNNIEIADDRYEAMLKAAVSDREGKKNYFLDYYRNRKEAATEIYKIMTAKHLLSDLSGSIRKVTQENRKQIMNFFLWINRVIMRGAELEMAYYKLAGQSSTASASKTTWERNMRNYAEKMASVERDVKAASQDQMKKDTSAIISSNSGLSNSQLARKIYDALKAKFDWSEWIVAIYKDVSGYDNHMIRRVSNAGADFFRQGGRNIVVGRANLRGSFSKSSADNAIQAVYNENSRTQNAQHYNDRLHGRYAVGRGPALLLTINAYRSNAPAWYTSSTSRVSARTIRFEQGPNSFNTCHALYFG